MIELSFALPFRDVARRRGLEVIVGTVFGAALLGPPPWVLMLLITVVLTSLWFVRTRRDVTTVVVGYLAALLLLPGNLGVSGLGSVGRPSLLAGLFCLAWYVSAALLPAVALDDRRQPVRWVLALWLAAAFGAYVVGQFRLLVDVEARALDRGLLSVLAGVGVALLVADGVGSRARLTTIIRWIVWLTTGMAVVGLVQFLTGVDPLGGLRLPGLSPFVDGPGVTTRSGVLRVSSTAGHPIEFGVVIASVLPLAVHLMSSERSASWRRRLAPVILLAMALPASVSRSGAIAGFVGLAVLATGWSWRARGRAMISGMVALLAIRFIAPGVIGTFRALFTGFSSDPSTSGRLEDYNRVLDLVSQTPFLGRGTYSFLPERYFLVDNQVLMTLLETGLLGLTSLGLLIVVSASCARGVWRNVGGPTGEEALAIAASICSIGVTFALFDVLSFSQASGLLYLLIGLAGATWRLNRRPRWDRVRLSSGRPNAPGRRVRLAPVEHD